MAFRKVTVIQVKEALRRWMRGEGERTVAGGIGNVKEGSEQATGEDERLNCPLSQGRVTQGKCLPSLLTCKNGQMRSLASRSIRPLMSGTARSGKVSTGRSAQYRVGVSIADDATQVWACSDTKEGPHRGGC